MCPKLKIRKCYLSFIQPTIWSGSCWNFLKWSVTYLLDFCTSIFRNWGTRRRNNRRKSSTGGELRPNKTWAPIRAFQCSTSRLYILGLLLSYLIYLTSSYLSWDRLSSFWSTDIQVYASATKFQPSTPLSTNCITFDWSAFLWLIKRSVDGRNFVIPAYPSAMEWPSNMIFRFGNQCKNVVK